MRHRDDRDPPHRIRRTNSGPLDPHGEIAARLRALYAEDLSQPIPAELIALLERLDEAEDRGQP